MKHELLKTSLEHVRVGLSAAITEAEIALRDLEARGAGHWASPLMDKRARQGRQVNRLQNLYDEFDRVRSRIENELSESEEA